MIFSRAVRPLLVAAAMAFIGLSAFASTAAADVYPSVNVDLYDTRLGAHSGMLVTADFDYSWIEADAEQHWDESLKNLVVETPAGLIGNPNAIPYEERCEPLVFETGTCPESSYVGTIAVLLETIGTVEEFYDYGYEPGTGGLVWASGDLALLKSDPEVPATIGMKITPSVSGFRTERQRIKIEPNTDEQLQLRTTTIDPIVNEQPLSGYPGQTNNLKVRYMEIEFFGSLANGNDFLTNPTECAPWTTRAWAQAWNLNTNANADPLGSGIDDFVTTTPSTIMPDCSNQASIPFPAKGTVSISSTQRDISPDFDFTVENPGVQANGQVSTSPKKVVARVPAAINVDVQQLGRVCTEADFVADRCAASTRVGNVKIETPLITAGLTGDVYLVKKAEAGLPDLGLRVRGAITFTQRGKTRYVGTKGNEIETTFDNIPQVGFSKLTFHIDGGPNGLLRTLACPVNNQQPVPGKFSYEFTAWTGATASSVTELNAASCFGVQKLRSFQCVYRLLRFQPTYTSRARVKKSVLLIDGKRVKTVTQVPFGFKVPVKRFKKGVHKIEVRATYDDGTVSKKRSKFRRC